MYVIIIIGRHYVYIALFNSSISHNIEKIGSSKQKTKKKERKKGLAVGVLF